MNNLSGSLSFNGNVSGQMGANLIPSVEANPSGTATEILTSIRVGDVIYSIPSGGGGGGGTNDYNSLLNKPKINNVILSGELSLNELGIQAKINFPNDNSKYLDGKGNFTTPAYFSGDYDDLTDKPQINSVTLEGNKTASDLKLISEMHTASGDEAAIETDDTLPLLSCISDINPVQSGSGTPSPSNPRPISGHTDVTITVASTSGGPGDDTTVSLGRTVYGGTLDVLSGELIVDSIMFEPASVSYYGLYGADNAPLFYYDIGTPIKPYIDNTSPEEDKLSSNIYVACNESTYFNMNNGECRTNAAIGSSNRIYFRDDRFTDEVTYNAQLAQNPLQLLAKLATPQTFNLTPEQIITLLGDNYIRSNTGDIEITYVTNVIDPLLKYLLENR